MVIKNQGQLFLKRIVKQGFEESGRLLYAAGLSRDMEAGEVGREVLLTVELKNVQNEFRDVVAFVRSKVRARVSAQGSQIQIDLSAKEMKLLLHKYLHHKGLDAYRVEVVHPGLVEVFSPEHSRPHSTSNVRGSPPSAAVTMPYEFPFSPALPGSPVKKKSRKK